MADRSGICPGIAEGCNGCYGKLFGHLLTHPTEKILPQPEWCQDVAYIGFYLDSLQQRLSDVETAMLSGALQVPGEAAALVEQRICAVITSVEHEPVPHLVYCRKGMEPDGDGFGSWLVCDAGHEWERTQTGWVLDISSVKD